MKHQMQPTWDTCVSARCAMILDIPVKEVIDEFHDDLMNHRIFIEDYLKKKGVALSPVLSTERKVIPDKVYLLIVPSSHKQGLTHQIIIDLRGKYTEIFDPNKGKPGKKHYVHFTEGSALDEDEVQIKSFVIEFEILGLTDVTN